MPNILNLPKIKEYIIHILKFFRYFLYRRNIIILVGDKGTSLYAIINKKIVDSLFIPIENRDHLNLYNDFFQKFKKFYVFLLLNNSECVLRHELIPVLHSIVKTNPVGKFIEEYFPKDNIVGYNIYNINTTPSETWDTLIVSSDYTPYLSKLIDFIVLNSGLQFSGIYFLALELRIIIDKIINKANEGVFSEHFQIFVCILKGSGINLVIKYKNNIITIQRFDYPTDKSDLYIQGMIEQEVSDYLINYKNYIENLNLKVCIIIIADDNFKLLAEHSQFGEHKLICKSFNQILGKTLQDTDKFADSLIIKLFNEQKTHSAYNKNLKTISSLNIFNSLVFKPLNIIIITLIITACIIKVKTLENQHKLTILHSHYSSAEQEYYEVKQRYPYIHKATNLADLYIFESLLQIPISIPFDLLEKFVRGLPDNLFLEGMKWERLDIDSTLISPNPYTKTQIFLKFIIDNTTVEEAMKILKQQIDYSTKTFGNIDTNVIIFHDQIVNLSNRIVIPLSIIISKNRG
ncbi:MAG: hypothetical protein LN588_03505 [Rickettsia endosymbiont of Bryobia graminum]|nr:hypothetical protein [Rickettsia endosymbiont of Bryobia graminum]